MPQADALGHGPLARELDDGRLKLTWGQAEAFADPAGPVYDFASPTTELEKGLDSVRFNVLEHIRDSKAEVVLISPYLIPGHKGMELLRDVRQRGVEVSILTNSLASTDQPLVHIGYRRYRSDLLRLGVSLYELSPLRARHESRKPLFGVSVGGLHTKAVVFDREELFIGSMNFDPRSDHYNSEMGLIVHSPALAQEALRLTDYAKVHGAHRLSLSKDGEVEWLPSADPDDEMHFDEPEARWWLKVLLDLLAPLAPEELL